jgi:hypothetical protein
VTYTQKASPNFVKSANLRAQAIALRIAGNTYAEIAATLGISTSTASVYINKGLNELNAESGTLQMELRTLQINRLEGMFLELWPRRRNPKISQVLIRILDREAKLCGLDMPIRVQHLQPTDETPRGVDLNKLSLEQLIQLEAILQTGQIAKKVLPPPNDHDADRPAQKSLPAGVPSPRDLQPASDTEGRESRVVDASSPINGSGGP